MMRTLLLALASATLLIVPVVAQTGNNAVPGQTTNFWAVTVAKDSSGAKDEVTIDLHNPKRVTVCKDNGGPDLRVSIDGKHWHVTSEYFSGCAQIAPVRFVRFQTSQEDPTTAEVYATY
jgi:hypothetical protein